MRPSITGALGRRQRKTPFGSIEVDGVPLSRVGLSRYRSGVASVMQDDQLFAGSIAENVCFFDPRPDGERIAACARMADVHDDIVAMPMKSNTLVGDMGTDEASGLGDKLAVLLVQLPPSLGFEPRPARTLLSLAG